MFAAGAFGNLLTKFILLLFVFPPVWMATVGFFYHPEPTGALIIRTAPELPLYNAGIPSGTAITGIQIENRTMVEVGDILDFYLSLDGLEPGTNLTIELWYPWGFHTNTSIISASDPGNVSRGVIGIPPRSVGNFYRPHSILGLFYLPTIFPYFYELIIVYSATINFSLMIFNLLPIPLLDGDRLFSILVNEKVRDETKRKYIINATRVLTVVVIGLNFIISFLVIGWIPI